MPKQIAFWVLMIVWPVVHFLIMRVEQPRPTAQGISLAFVMWVLFFLLGWQVFGFVIQ